ncbi:MAG: methyltransferase [Candidatus Lokiarchaeota archaeon]|nr:methyltransferase [Candidatus Lokiarchaeota archaeon]MBD3339489.1 methyltransferase [Candidatus Lokiarchaeota archaeon]
MNHKERFLATIERRKVDRPACWLGMPVPEALERLCEYFKASNLQELKIKINSDIWDIDVPYNHPPNNHIAMAFDFPKKGQDMNHRTLTAPGFFEDYKDPLKDDIDAFEWPEPSEHIDPEECQKLVEEVPDQYPIMGVLWSAHFQDIYSAFGMSTAFVKMLRFPEIFKAVHERIIDFYLKANKIFYDATKGYLDAVLIGNDFGGQKRLMVSPENIRKFALPGAKKIIDQAKSYGLKVIYHSCGSIFEIIQELINLGVDAIHPIQALAANMELERLKKHFLDKISFCGGIDAQNLLVFGTPDQIKEKVRELKSLMPTGLILSPSHEAILPDIPPENIEALFEAVNE